MYSEVLSICRLRRRWANPRPHAQPTADRDPGKHDPKDAERHIHRLGDAGYLGRERRVPTIFDGQAGQAARHVLERDRVGRETSRLITRHHRRRWGRGQECGRGIHVKRIERSRQITKTKPRYILVGAIRRRRIDEQHVQAWRRRSGVSLTVKDDGERAGGEKLDAGQDGIAAVRGERGDDGKGRGAPQGYSSQSRGGAEAPRVIQVHQRRRGSGGQPQAGDQEQGGNFHKMIGIWFFARPLVLSATRVKEN